MTMWHFSLSLPNKHVLLHLENKLCRPDHLCSTTKFYLYEVIWILHLVILALIYQSCLKTGADLSAELVLRQDTRVIYETFISDQSRRTNDRQLNSIVINMLRP